MIKTDNIGNLSTVLYAYTDNVFDLNVNKSYTNGKMSTILFNKLKNKQYNKQNKKDYYFLVLNKTNQTRKQESPSRSVCCYVAISILF